MSDYREPVRTLAAINIIFRSFLLAGTRGTLEGLRVPSSGTSQFRTQIAMACTYSR
jgi:hypothetical protein